MKFALSLCFVVAFSSTPAMAGLRSSHPDGQTREERTNRAHHGRQLSDNRYQHHYVARSSRHNQGATRYDETNEYDTKIVGGNTASVGEYPYFVDWFGCGGSLIAPDLVLTAAHCGASGDLGDAIVGGYKSGSTANGAARVATVKAVPHPKYNKNTDEWDFMLLKLASPVNNREVVLLNFDAARPTNGQDLTVIGVGLLSEGGSDATTLQEVVVNHIPVSECNKATMYNGEIFDQSMFCAGVVGGGKDSCHGDSGGPIVIQQNGKDVQVGVVSWGYGCALANGPGVYARVSAATDWIKREGCKLSTSNPSFCGSVPVPAPVPPPVPAPVIAPTTPTTTSGCATTTVNFEADRWPEDNDFFLENLATGQYIWDAFGFSTNQVVQKSMCIDRTGCHVFDFWDEEGDGLLSPGMLTLTYDGSQVYKSRNLGTGVVLYLGTGCAAYQ